MRVELRAMATMKGIPSEIVRSGGNVELIVWVPFADLSRRMSVGTGSRPATIRFTRVSNFNFTHCSSAPLPVIERCPTIHAPRFSLRRGLCAFCCLVRVHPRKVKLRDAHQ